MKIAIVIARYHNDISGGAETEARHYAEILARKHTVTVLTSTAKDYITWENVLEPGKKEGNPAIIRFDSSRKRNINNFNRYSYQIFKKKSVLPEEEERWLELQGPVVTGLVDYIRDHNRDYDCFIFFSYIYYPFVKAVPYVKNRTILVPTLHNEKPAYLGLYKKTMTNELIYAFNTPEELELFQSIYGFIPDRFRITGMDVEPQDFIKSAVPYDNYFFSVGRIDEGKGYGMLIEYFRRWNQGTGNHYKLVLAGKPSMKIPKDKNIVVTGFVTEAEKVNLIENSIALLNPSPLESFSIVLMESWLSGKPVIVNGASEVMVGHCVRSNGGLWFNDYQSFREVMDYVISHPDRARTMGKNGSKYVRQNYSGNVVGKKLDELIRMVAG